MIFEFLKLNKTCFLKSWELKNDFWLIYFLQIKNLYLLRKYIKENIVEHFLLRENEFWILKLNKTGFLKTWKF